MKEVWGRAVHERTRRERNGKVEDIEVPSPPPLGLRECVPWVRIMMSSSSVGGRRRRLNEQREVLLKYMAPVLFVPICVWMGR